MQTRCLQLLAAATLMLCTGCQTCIDNFNRFEAWKTEKCCSLFHCHRGTAPAPVVYAPVAQACPQPVAIAQAAPCAQPAPICAPIQCDPCAAQAAPVSAAAPCCPQPCCPPVCCVNECSPCSVSYGSSMSCDSCNVGSSGGVIVNEQPTYRDSGTTIQGTPNLAPGPAAIGR